MSGPYKIALELHESIYTEQIAARYLPKSRPQKHPCAIITGGQPGSGKSGLTAMGKDPAYAVELLNSILEDGDQGELLIALRQMTKAFGGVSKVAEKAQLNGTHIYLNHRRTTNEQ